MFDKIIEFIISIIDMVLPFTIVKQYDEGIFLNLGKYTKTVKPGFHWKVPFLQEIMVHTVVTDTIAIPRQALTTKDKKQIIVKSVVKYKVDDVSKFLLEVQGASEALSDIAQSIIKKQITSRTYDECSDDTLDNEITKKLRVEVKRWGIDVNAVTLTTLSLGRPISIFND